MDEARSLSAYRAIRLMACVFRSEKNDFAEMRKRVTFDMNISSSQSAGKKETRPQSAVRQGRD
jgi:hypothetical protein